MKIRYLLVVITLFFISCGDIQDEHLSIEGITYTDIHGNVSNIDYNDWNLNEEFTSREKQLFDSLNFNKTAKAETDVNSVYYNRTPYIKFYPNPFSTTGFIQFYRPDLIYNVVVSDNKYNKLVSFRWTDKPLGCAYNFSTLNSGIYRMYYVIQDLKYNIVYQGHGDIQKE